MIVIYVISRTLWYVNKREDAVTGLSLTERFCKTLTNNNLVEFLFVRKRKNTLDFNHSTGESYKNIGFSKRKKKNNINVAVFKRFWANSPYPRVSRTFFSFYLLCADILNIRAVDLLFFFFAVQFQFRTRVMRNVYRARTIETISRITAINTCGSRRR